MGVATQRAHLSGRGGVLYGLRSGATDPCPRSDLRGIFEDYLDLISSDPSWVDPVTKSTSDPQKIDCAFQTWKDRLAAILRDVPPNDGQRYFSRELKKELFEQDKKCEL